MVYLRLGKVLALGDPDQTTNDVESTCQSQPPKRVFQLCHKKILTKRVQPAYCPSNNTG